MIVVLLAVVTVALGIADLIYSQVTYCQSDTYSTSCSPTPGTNYPNVLIFTWVSGGIWGGALVLLAAVATMQLARNQPDTSVLNLWMFIAVFITLLVIPGMVAVETVLAYYITTEGGGFYEVGGSDTTTQQHILFALPIAIGILGVLEFLLLGFLLLTYYSRHRQDARLAGVSDTDDVKVVETYETTPTYDPYGGAPQPQPYSRSPSNYFGDSGYGGGGYGGGYY